MANTRDTITAFLKGKGLGPAAIAAALGNMMVESGLKTTASNSAEGAIGLVQWEGGRRTALQNYARAHGTTETDLNTQLNFMWHELSTSYSGVLSQLKHATDPSSAAAIWDAHYEVSAGTTRQQRISYAQQFYSGEGPSGGSSGSSFSAEGTFTPDAAQGTTKADLQGVDGLGSLLDSVPELSKLVDQAISNNWTSDKFQNAVEDSKWWKTHSSTARSVITQQANDPASYKESFNNTKNSISSLSKQLGMKLTGAQLTAITNSALLSGNDSNQQWLTQQISSKEHYGNVKDLGTLQGGMAATAQQLQAQAADYGFNWSPAVTARHAQLILSGAQTLDTYKAELVKWAKSAFPALASQLDHGSTVKDLADPYVQSMSQLLEVDPGTLDVYNPTIRKALQGSVPQGAKDKETTPLWQFENQVRQDPRWQFTDNANQQMSSMALQLGQTWGFNG